MKIKLNLNTFLFILTFLVSFISIGFSAFNSSLVFEDMAAYIRTESDIRITGISIESSSNALSEGENYNTSSIKATFILPEKTSSITYRIKITNFEAQEMGIYQITGLPDYLTYEISNYKLKEKICNKESRCNLGIVKDDLLLTIKYKNQNIEPSIINHNINLNFDFRNMYSITYNGITNNGYPTSIIEGDNLEIKFNNALYNVVAYINGVKDYSKYTYENGILNINNVSSNIVVEYKEKVYLASLPQNTYFKESTYLTKIKTISFVNHINIPSDRLVTYDLSKNVDNSIIGWIDKDYNLYIGSDFKIYGTSLYEAFYEMSGVTSIAFDNLNTSEVTDMANMFKNCSGLTTLDLSSFNTSSVTNMHWMFNGVSSLKTLDISNFDTTKIRSLNGMFYNMRALTTLNISNIDTSNIWTMQYMFANCKNLTSLNLEHFDTSKVTDMQYMFSNAQKLSNLNISNFDTSSVKNMSYMFENAYKLSNLDLSNFNTKNVTKASSMFYNVGQDESLSSFKLKLGNNFNLGKVTDFKYMFYQAGYSSDVKTCTIDLGSNFDTSNATNMSNMFNRACSYSTTTTINFGNNFDTSNVTDMSNMFEKVARNNSNFVLDLGDKFVFKDGVTVTNFASSCGAGKLIIPKTVTNIPNSTFSGMTKLKEIEFKHSATDSITLPTPGSSTGAFYTSTALNTTVTTVNDTIKNYGWKTDNRTVTFK